MSGSSLTGVTVAGLELKNPVIAGSGEATADGVGIMACLEAGAAAVVAKSTNESEAAKRQLESAEYVLLDEHWRELPWGPAPRTASLFARSGLVGEPFDRWLATLAECDREAERRGAYVIGSLVVSGVDEAVRMAKEMEAAGLRWVELNVGAPHAGEASPGAIRAAVAPEVLFELVGPVRQAVSVPLTVKLGAEGDLVSLARAARECGADAVCLAGRPLAFLPDVRTRKPFLGTFGAIGGAWSLPLTLRWIAKARLELGPDLGLIGTGGARDGLDVVRFLLAGASAVQMTTAVFTGGSAAISGALNELERYLEEQGVPAASLIGEAADRALTYEEAGKREEERG